MNDFIDLWRRYSPSTVLVGRSKLKLGLDISRRSGGRIRSSPWAFHIVIPNWVALLYWPGLASENPPTLNIDVCAGFSANLQPVPRDR
jgi:hypothetical protein